MVSASDDKTHAGSEHQRLRAIVRGRVQGVNFRWHTREHARQNGLTGWVRNLPGGGAVEVVAEGSNSQLSNLLHFLQNGPPMARVDQVKVEWMPARGEFSEFSIRFR